MYIYYVVDRSQLVMHDHVIFNHMINQATMPARLQIMGMRMIYMHIYDIYMSSQVYVPDLRSWDKVKKNVKLKFHMFICQSKQVSHSFSHYIINPSLYNA